MSEKNGPIAFFDVLGTVASVRISPGGELREFTIVPHLEETLRQLRADGVRLGLIWLGAEATDESLEKGFVSSGLAPYFEETLVLRGTAAPLLLFEHAAGVHGPVAALSAAGHDLLFVSGSSYARAQARAAGFLTAPHPVLAHEVIRRRSPFRYLRIRVPPGRSTWPTTLREWGVAPLHVSGGASERPQVYAIASLATAARLDELGFEVDRLGANDEPQTTDLYLLGNTLAVSLGFSPGPEEATHCTPGPDSPNRILASTHEGLFVSIPAGRTAGSYCFPVAHHDVGMKLLPTLGLLSPFERPEDALLEPPACKVVPLPATLKPGEKRLLDERIIPRAIREHVERYSGAEPLSTGPRISSRHLFHPHNGDAVDALVRDLNAVAGGRLNAGKVPFQHGTGTFNNVEASLPAQNRGGIVIISAHMDSTAERKSGYQKPTHDAHGADDDASGVAAVLCAADALVAMADAAPGLDRHEIRFVLFNGEEEQRAGSVQYAAMRSAAPIIAVFQMDMIAYDVREPPTFELHAGCEFFPHAQRCSQVLTALVRDLVPVVAGARLVPQLWPDPLTGFDPAQHRSDHHSFHPYGIAACLISEDLWDQPGLGGQRREKNPKWHLPDDDVDILNTDYAADIARTVAAAVWITATR